jgi:adenylyltransferase/sulfurtransferase
MTKSDTPVDLPPGRLPERYSRQVLFKHLGEAGQRRLLQSRVTLFGCGALGSVQAETLVRAGVGYLRIVDRDFLEINNLQRQVLFDEQDVADNLPKAEAARRRLSRINSTVTIEAEVADANPTNIERLADGADLLLDGTDNFETRFLINDLAVSTKRPWIYGAAIEASGLCLPVIPQKTPCLRCIFEESPPPEFNPTCDTVGVLGPVVQMVAGLQAIEAIKILTGRLNDVTRRLVSLDVWRGRFGGLDTSRARIRGDCPCCGEGRYEYLEGKLAGTSTTLCGRNAVQVSPGPGLRMRFEAIADKLRSAGGKHIIVNRFMLKANIGPYELALFPDGRAIVSGTNSEKQARAVYARYIGA